MTESRNSSPDGAEAQVYQFPASAISQQQPVAEQPDSQPTFARPEDIIVPSRLGKFAKYVTKTVSRLGTVSDKSRADPVDDPNSHFRGWYDVH